MYTGRCQTSTPSIRIPGVPQGENFSPEATGSMTRGTKLGRGKSPDVSTGSTAPAKVIVFLATTPAAKMALPPPTCSCMEFARRRD